MANLEKKHMEQKKIHKLLIYNKEIKDTMDILRQEHIFYRQLYKKRTHSNIEIDLLDTETKTINEDERYRCDGHLSEYTTLHYFIDIKHYFIDIKHYFIDINITLLI